jgi:hypothetical protein
MMLPLIIDWTILRSIGFPFELYLPRAVELKLVIVHLPRVGASHYFNIIKSGLARSNTAILKLDLIIHAAPIEEFRLDIGTELLGRSCGSLTSLELADIKVDTPPALSGLRKLSLESCEIRSRDLHHLLSSTPLLDKLTLRDLLFMDLPDNMDGYDELSMVNLPHLRTLRVTAWNKSFIIFALVIVPNPSESLTLENTSDHDDEPFSSQRGFDSLLLARIHEFWEQRTGLTNLPPLSLSADGSGDHTEDPDEWIHYDFTLEIENDVGSHEPTGTTLSWKTNCIITGPDAMLSSITTFNMVLNGDRIGLQAHRGRLNVDLLTHLQHVDLDEAFVSDALWQKVGAQDLVELEAWIRTFVDAGRPLKTLSFTGCNTKMKKFAEEIEKSGLVEEMIWT